METGDGDKVGNWKIWSDLPITKIDGYSVNFTVPDHDLASCLTANHLGLFDPPDHLKRLWIARDNDEAGEAAAERLRATAERKDIWVGDLVPQLEDFNKDLQEMGLDEFRAGVIASMDEG